MSVPISAFHLRDNCSDSFSPAETENTRSRPSASTVVEPAPAPVIVRLDVMLRSPVELSSPPDGAIVSL